MEPEFEVVHSIKHGFLPFSAHRNLVEHSTFTNNWHEQIELLFIEEGEGEIFLNFTPYKAVEGDVFIVNSNHVHCVSSMTSITAYSVIVHNDVFSAIELTPRDTLFEKRIHDETAAMYFNRFIDEFESDLSFRNKTAVSSLFLLILYLVRNYSSVSQTTKSNNSVVKIQKAMSYMQNHLAENITGDIVAEQIKISKCHFLRELKKLTGYTFSDYINNLRCSHASNLLADKKLSLSEIARKCGYENFPYFSRTFKKIYGVSPLQFRKNLMP